MDSNKLVLKVIKDENIKKNLNHIVYYCIKMIYDSEFKKRSRIFCRCINNFFKKISKNFNLDKYLNINENHNNENNINIENNNNNNLDINSIITSILNILENDNFFNKDDDYYIESLLSCEHTYLLDSDEDYCLVYLIKEFMFDSQAPNLSELMRGYKLFVSSVELIFCFRLLLHNPIAFFMRREKIFISETVEILKVKVKKFCLNWVNIYPNKYKNNLFIHKLLSKIIDENELNKFNSNEDLPKINSMDFIALSLDDPTLSGKNIGIIKLIKEGPFLYEINEIAKQLCLIDHKNFSEIHEKDFIDYIVNKEIPNSFNKIYKREMHFKCYIVIFLFLCKNLESQKKAIQNFILLADQCKSFNNYQSEYTIISTLNALKITSKNFLWKMIDQKIKDVYSIMEAEYLDFNLNEKTFFDKLTKSETFIPHCDLIKNQINNLIIQIKMSGEKQKVILCREFRDFFAKIIDYNRNKYSFFLVNPLNDFLNNDFWEICKTKEWGIKTKFDLSQYSDENSDAEKMFDGLVKQFKKIDM